MKRIVIANWKMNLSLAEALALAQQAIRVAEDMPHVQVVIAPSFVWLVPLNLELRIKPGNFSLSGQSVSQWPDGAYTGDVSAKQLSHLVDYCLVGHSERRRFYHEGGDSIAGQIKQLLAHKITPVICFGEMSQSKQSTVSSQITIDLRKDLVGLSAQEIGRCLFAYEPLWAIGTGMAATPDYAKRVIEHTKQWANEQYGVKIPVLYGGSVTEDNAADFGTVKTIDGLLVGGASLHAKRFAHICERFSGHV